MNRHPPRSRAGGYSMSWSYLTRTNCYSMISTMMGYSVHPRHQVLGGFLGYLRWMMTMNCYSRS
ncbi:MAG: hypothetical protein ACO2O1_00600 [Candidatus Caldarchaeales archaeon]